MPAGCTSFETAPSGCMGRGFLRMRSEQKQIDLMLRSERPLASRSTRSIGPFGSYVLIMSPAFLIEQLLNGVQLAVMLFLMAAGLQLVFGVLGMHNLAPGPLSMPPASFSP